MSGFTDSIVGGVGSLIRKYIKSPNYIKGVSGWSINQDGSAEFNNGTFRGTVVIDSSGVALLVYNGTPALNSLILAIAAQSGVDSYGNHYNNGLTFSTDYLNPALSWLDSAGTWLHQFPYIRATLADGLEIQGPGLTPAFLSMADNSTTQLDMYHNGSTVQSIESHQDGLSINAGNYTNFYAKDDGSGFCFGTAAANNGIVGKYYHEDGNLTGGITTGGTTFDLTPISTISDYGSAISGTTWTAPVSGVYLINASIDVHGTFSSGIRTAFAINTSTGLLVQDDTTIPAANQWTKQVTLCKYLLVGTTVTITSFMASGTSLSIFNSSFAFHRLV